jgi:hypothetical protein
MAIDRHPSVVSCHFGNPAGGLPLYQTGGYTFIRIVARTQPRPVIPIASAAA